MTTIASLFRRSLPALVALLLFFTVAACYFAPQFGGDVLPQHDVQQYEGASREVYQSREQYGEDPQWLGSMFGGMPAYLVNVRYPAQLVKDTVGQVVRIIDTPAAFLFFAMCAMWIMLLMTGVNPWVGIVPSLAYGLSTYFILIIGAGHITKMWALVYAPLMMGGIWMTLRTKHPWRGAALTALFASLEIGANHPQITYYFLLAAAFFWVSEGVTALREKRLGHFARRTAVLLAAGIVALGSNFAPLWYTAQHAEDTMRGGSEQRADAQDGLNLDYATAWSYGPAESWNLLIPDFMGSDSARSFSPSAAPRFWTRAMYSRAASPFPALTSRRAAGPDRTTLSSSGRCSTYPLMGPPPRASHFAPPQAVGIPSYFTQCGVFRKGEVFISRDRTPPPAHAVYCAKATAD